MSGTVLAGNHHTNRVAEGRLIRAIVVHNSIDVIEWIRESLSGDGRISVVADCLTGAEVRDAIKRHNPELLLVGLSSPGLDALGQQVRNSGIVAFVIDDREMPPDKMKFFDLDNIIEGRGFGTSRVLDVAAEAEKRLGQARNSYKSADVIDLLSGRAPVKRRDKLAFKSGKLVVALSLSEVFWLETVGDGTRIHTVSSSYDTKTRISEFAAKPQLALLKPIRSGILVNMEHVREIRWRDGISYLTLDNDKEFRVAAQYKMIKKLVEALWK